MNFEHLKDAQVKIQGKNCIAEIFGILNEDKIHEFALEVEKYLFELNLTKTAIKRTFLVVIEGLQNILRHGHFLEDKPKVGGCLVVENEGTIEVFCMNNIRANEKSNIELIIKEINNLSPEELKANYIDELSTGNMSERNGAGLGLMTIRLKAGKPIDCFFYNINEEWHGFAMVCAIDKEFS
ncbi:MAG: hypothetical protein KJ941_01375 [Bacteroidetes bacterium]|nr:hypothetical protein [Bacteroidota bacterium]